jgi:hypothetical protein
MTLRVASREYQRLREVAREYRQSGYDVIVEPKVEQLPAFLAPFNIDMVARSNDENVVVEVRTQESLTQAPELDALARAIQGEQSWRLELVVTNPKDRTVFQFRNATSLDQHDIAYRLQEARQLSDQEHGEAAFLMAWSATEALLRHIVERESIPAAPNQPAQLVKALYMYGVIDNDQYRVLQEGQQTRNLLAHGYKEQQARVETFDQLLLVTEKLAKQYLAH